VVPVTQVRSKPTNMSTADVWAIGRAVTGTKSQVAGDRCKAILHVCKTDANGGSH
jgi:hypothetical protein